MNTLTNLPIFSNESEKTMKKQFLVFNVNWLHKKMQIN